MRTHPLIICSTRGHLLGLDLTVKGCKINVLISAVNSVDNKKLKLVLSRSFLFKRIEILN